MITLSTGSRQPTRDPWPLECLIHERSVALGMAIDSSTHSAYTSALNSYITFCQLHQFPLEPTEDSFSFFAVYMSHHINPRSVDAYLSGICNQLEPHFPNVRTIRKGLLVSRTICGCKRLRGTPVKRKLPLSTDGLLHVIKDLELSSDHDDKLFLTQILTGFHGLLRLVELGMPDPKKHRNWRKFTLRSSVEWLSSSTYAFILPAHKADITFESNKILGATPAVIQATGRWSSEAFRLYIRKNPILLQALLFGNHGN
ncbi:hypothetical protein JAAARDRAFT_133012 [Jaapia argillacea MUCL 33604]|uniref:Core-binding (CB) domain-containing protein n=1 Tax=Jaapia argillacea MUCL 33604 TaxID=933084 RepID=A0A067Q096_9AGAM|nr:hypothetical protein JAAARDRAFT_133012 [Jaapia argillacea MUCL 33604]